MISFQKDRDETQTIAFGSLLGEQDWVEISHQLSLLPAVYLSAECSPEPPPPTPSHRAHCTSRPHLVPHGWFFICCCIVFPLAGETNSVFPQECFSCLDQSQANENKMEQNNASSSKYISASKTSIHLQVFVEWKLFCTISTVPVKVLT